VVHTVDNDKYSAESLYYPYAKSRNVVYMLIVCYSAWCSFDFLISLIAGSSYQIWKKRVRFLENIYVEQFSFKNIF
jgi:hypothetical protein